MKKKGKIVIGGIENKIFNLVTITILMILLVFGTMIYIQTKKLSDLMEDTNAKQRESISGISSETMTQVIYGTLGETALMQGYIADNLFSGVAGEVRMLQDYAVKLYNSPGEHPRIPVAEPDKANDKKVKAQLLYGEDVNIADPAVADEIGLVGNMSDMMCSLYSAKNVSSAFISTATGLTVIADETSGSKFLEDGSRLRISGTTRPWYKGAADAGTVYFTDVEVDTFTGKIGIVCSAPVYQGDKLVAVVGADLFLDSMAAAIEGTNKESGFSMIINQDGHVVFSPRKSGLFSTHAVQDAVDLRKVDNKELADFITKALSGSTDISVVNVEGKPYYMCGSPMGTVGWAVIVLVDKEITETPTKMMDSEYRRILDDAYKQYDKNTSSSRTTTLILIGLILLFGVVNGVVLAKKIVRPLNTMTQKVAELNGDNLDFEMEKTYQTNDEVQTLAEAFSTLSNRTKSYISEITRITAEKERIGAELNVATQIQADMLPRNFPAFPERHEFDIYASMNPAKEVGGDFYDFFLVDDDHIALVMADVSGKGVPAALFMVIAKTLIKNRTLSGGTPSEILSDVNEQLCEGNEADLFVTVWLAIIEISTGRGVAANAGHEHPAIRGSSGKYELVVYRHSPAVATMEGMRFKEHDFQLNPGDQLFVYTDGVAEATDANQELYGTERMLTALNKVPDADPKESLDNVMEGINSFVLDAEQFDDITMMSFRYYGPEK